MLLSLEIAGGIGDREIVRRGCEQPDEENWPGCYSLQGNHREDLPLVLSQLIDCTPDYLVHNVSDYNNELIQYCDAEQLAESFDGYGRLPATATRPRLRENYSLLPPRR